MQIVLTGIAIIDIIIAMARKRGIFVAQFIRPIIFVMYVRSLRDTLYRIFLVMWDS